MAALTHGQAIITTATAENGLIIENPDAIRFVNMALITEAPIRIFDPYSLVIPHLPPEQSVSVTAQFLQTEHVGVAADHHIHLDLPATVLVLRPSSLVAEMGCNRNTGASGCPQTENTQCDPGGCADNFISSVSDRKTRNT